MRGPLNAQPNRVAFQMPSFQLCRCTGKKRQNWCGLADYTSEVIEGDHLQRFVCG